MKSLEADVVVIGGGSTGVGVVRDAAMRGYRAVLLERADLGQGTTARFHGLLHSGGRYVVSDPQSATECAEENAILRRIQASAVEDTGGFFVLGLKNTQGMSSCRGSDCSNSMAASDSGMWRGFFDFERAAGTVSIRRLKSISSHRASRISRLRAPV